MATSGQALGRLVQRLEWGAQPLSKGAPQSQLGHSDRLDLCRLIISEQWLTGLCWRTVTKKMGHEPLTLNSFPRQKQHWFISVSMWWAGEERQTLVPGTWVPHAKWMWAHLKLWWQKALVARKKAVERPHISCLPRWIKYTSKYESLEAF